MVQHLERGRSHERTSINQADEPQGDSSEPTDLLCPGNERCYDQLCSTVNNNVMMNEVQNRGKATRRIDLVNQSAGFSMEEEDVEDNRGRLVQPIAGASSSRGLKYNTSESRGDPIPLSSAKLVGRAFEENKNVIWSLLMDGKFSTIAIYGMGELGKRQCYNISIRTITSF